MIKDLKKYLMLWSTQSISQLGSSVTAFALTLWLYEKTGSSLNTAALTICSYLPYILLSIFAGAITDKLNKKKAMLLCDFAAALSSCVVLALYLTDGLCVWHLYAINVFSGLMNTIQQPASEVALTMLVPKEYYQRTSGLNSLARSTTTILSPLIATALYSLAGLKVVIYVDLATFAIAFLTLLIAIDIPNTARKANDSVLKLAGEGLQFLKANPLVLWLILFMSGVNLVASAFDAVLPGYIIPNPRGGNDMLGIVISCSGIAMIIGSLIVTVLPKPKNRVRVVYLTMLFSLGTENFMLAFVRSPIWWCVGQVIGWIVVPIMSANLDVIMRSSIPAELQGRVYACRNTMQFFTIPIGTFFGGIMVDKVCEPLMSRYKGDSIMNHLFGVGKGSGAALMMFILGFIGVMICLLIGVKVKKYKFIEK